MLITPKQTDAVLSGELCWSLPRAAPAPFTQQREAHLRNCRDARYNVTGGTGMRDWAYFNLREDVRTDYAVPTDLLLAGALDAPVYLPAGACDSTTWTNGRGEWVPRPSMVYRPGQTFEDSLAWATVR